MSDWQSWHPVTNHFLHLYAVECWISDGEGMGDAQERSQEAGRTSVSTIVYDGFKQLKA